MIKGIILGLLCFVAFILSHIFIFHNFNIKRRFYTMVKLFLFIPLIYTTLFSFTSEVRIQRYIETFSSLALVGFLNGTFLHFLFCYFYLYFIQIVDRSPSTRILIEIENSAERRLNTEQIKQKYSIGEKVLAALEDMVILGRLAKERGSYKNTLKGNWHCKIFRFIREYLKLHKC